MTAALAPAPDLLDLTRLQREDVTRLLDEGGVVAYGLVDGILEVLQLVGDPAATNVYDTPWRITERFGHGWRETRRVGLTQAHNRLAAVLAAGGVQTGALPAKPEGWWGWR